MDGSTGRCGALIQLALRAAPSTIGATILVVGLIAGSPIIQGTGLFVFGLGSVMVGVLEAMNWRKFAEFAGQNERLGRMSGWLLIVGGILMMLLPISVFFLN